jgi:hypothetical protein
MSIEHTCSACCLALVADVRISAVTCSSHVTGLAGSVWTRVHACLDAPVGICAHASSACPFASEVQSMVGSLMCSKHPAHVRMQTPSPRM